MKNVVLWNISEGVSIIQKSTCHAVFGKFFDKFKYFADHFRVKCRCRFIKKHYIGVHRKCTHDCDTLLLTS